MDVGKIFNGIAVIVDNKIEDVDSSIYRIKTLIEAKNIPVVSYSDIPSEDVIASFDRASFIILDWDYSDGELGQEEGERLSIPEELKQETEKRLVSFIRKLLSDTFVPIFIFTGKSEDMVTDSLRDESLWRDEGPNRIFVKQKSDIHTEEALFSSIEEWVKSMPSVYVLKCWEGAARQAKTAMFNELYDCSPNWTGIIWEMLKGDSRDNIKEFGDFVTRQFVNRIGEYTFEENIISKEPAVNADELLRVVQGERYITYTKPQVMAYTGDLFREDDTYYLNVRAQCDLAREPDPELYLISGKALSAADIALEDIRLTSDKRLHVDNLSYTLDEVDAIFGSVAKLKKLNYAIAKQKNKAFFSHGNIIGKKIEIIIPCIAEQGALKFSLDIAKMQKYSEIRGKLIGRILPPYITQIQQSCASHIVREGVMPTPKSVFNHLEL